MPAAGSNQDVLRRKYLDWCSARIVDRFLDLTPEEIYRIAHGEEEGASAEADEPSASFSEASEAAEGRLSYSELVERVTERLAARLRLPGFAEWERAYRSDPARYESELLGFWQGDRRQRD